MQSRERKSSRPRPKSFETRPETFETEIPKNGSRDETKFRDSITAKQHEIQSCIEQHEMQKQTFDHRKAENAMSAKRILHETLQEKLKQSWVSNVQGKLTNKTTSSSAPPTKKLFGLRIRENHAESASAETKLRFLSTQAHCVTASSLNLGSASLRIINLLVFFPFKSEILLANRY